MRKRTFFILICIASLFACSKPKLKEPQSSMNSWMNFDLPPADKTKAAKLNLELGLSYLTQDQVSRAKSKFIKAKELAPDLPEVHYTYGYFLERVGENTEAQKAYEKAISLNPTGGNEHNMYAAFLCRQHQYKHSEKEFLKALEDPNFNSTSQAYENAGLCVLQIPDVAKATEYFEKALRYDSARSDSLLELGIIKYQLGQFNEAKEFHERFAKLSKPTARSLLLAIEIARHFGDKNKEQSNKILLNAQYPNAKVTDILTKSRS
ncbi:MAG: type IV pilus biogenesis/stability protein PilW [Proteobacteria bacterium]|nr:type IV pilus biogenesis/stability protein PilW [Pseudomonadota bacterium]